MFSEVSNACLSYEWLPQADVDSHTRASQRELSKRQTKEVGTTTFVLQIV